MKKNNTITINDLANLMTSMQNDMALVANAVKSIDARLTALEEGKVSAKASKPTVQKSKTSVKPTATATATPTAKWILDKRCVYSAPNEWISKKARYAFKMQAEENGGFSLNEVERTALVKKLGDKYVTCRQFSSEKAAKEFFKKWTAQ